MQNNIKNTVFKTSFAENIFYQKYAQGQDDTWAGLSKRVVEDVCGKAQGRELDKLLSDDDMSQLIRYIEEMKFIPGGRYLYYAGREMRFYNNCFLLRAKDSREGWAELASHSTLALMSGGGIGVDYSEIRPKGKRLKRTGGMASGAIPLMKIINEIGRNVMQGGSRRSAIYASLNHQHEDINDFLQIKQWDKSIIKAKLKDFNFSAPLDMTNISVNWDNNLLAAKENGNIPDVWHQSVLQMMQSGEPGHSYNFNENSKETLRNACGEICSEDDSDVCNLGSVNMANIDSLEEFKNIVQLGSKFLINGTIRGDLPYKKVYDTRDKNRRIGLGIMGVHEWLMKRGYKYEVCDELKLWLEVWRDNSEIGANEQSDRLSLKRPVKYRAVAPTGTIGIMASTTTGIEPLFATAYKRRYLVGGDKWLYEYVVDATANKMITDYSLNPNEIETAYSLAKHPETRIKFQFDVQSYTDHAISSTINLPEWGTEYNNPDTVKQMSGLLLKYCEGLRGITVYPNGSRGGQPLTEVPYDVAIKHSGVVFDEVEEKCSGGVCGL